MKVNVHVRFEGVVTVEVPTTMSKDDAAKLATEFALARVLATTQNPDGMDEDAFDIYLENCSKQGRKNAEKDWDASTASVGGQWDVVE